MLRRTWLLLALPAAITLLALLVSCGKDPDHDFGQPVGPPITGSGGSNGTLDISLSDPTTCSPSHGPFSHIFVTITDVQASTVASAATGSTTLVDLTPNLKSVPVQVDLLGTPNTQCLLAQLASVTSIPAGTYQQVRVLLLSNTSNIAISGNQCVGAFNCVVISSNPIPQTLSINTESTDGIILTGSQLIGGGFTITAGQSTKLNIDFNACESIVQDSSGLFRLKAVLHAGELSATASTISGTVVDSANGNALTSGTAIIALEQADSSGIDRVIMQTLADTSGNFSFCPVAAGTYDIVAVAVSSSGAQFAPTVTIGVQAGTSVGSVPLIVQAGSTSPATITGTVSTAGFSGAGANVDVVVSALEQAGGIAATIPFAQQSETSAIVTTAPTGSCASGSNCANYSLTVPASNPNVGTFATATTTQYTQAAGNATYVIDGQAFVVNTPSTPDCTLPDVQVGTLSGGGALTVTAGAIVTAATIQFTSCQ